jgi:hypothetical protein
MTLILSGTNGLSDVDGSAATPAIRGTDANTGIFFGTDIIGFSEGGVEAARINADSQFVAAAGTAALPVITTTGDLNTGIFFPAADTIAFSEGGAEVMRIDSSGNLLVGTTSTTGVQLATAGGLATNGVEYFWLSRSAGGGSTMNVGRTSGAGTGALVEWCYNGAARGTVTTNGTTVAYNTSSDYRLKENVQPMQNALSIVAQLNPVTYTWKSDGSDGQGFIAHELQALVPDCVVGEKDAIDVDGNPVYQGIDTSFLVATLTAAIQEQQTLITALTARITAIETNSQG